MFHYPPNLSLKELSKDKKAVKLGLMEMSKLFGTFEKSVICQRPVSFYHFAIGGGDIPYWKKNPQFVEVRYETKFSKEGEGFIFFWVVQMSKKLELRSASFGIPVNSLNAKERFEKIFGYMMDFMKEVGSNEAEIEKRI